MYDYVVVGASKAGCSVVSNLLATKEQHRILLVNGEKLYPYDKPPLSKEVIHAGKDPIDFPLLTDAQLADPRLTLVNATKAESVDYANNTLRLDNNKTVQYGRLVVATGARARQPFVDVPPQVLTLRNYDDSCRFHDVIKEGGRLVIIGGGFIGFEVASSVRKLGNAVTIIEIAPVPLQRGAGQVVGEHLSTVAQDHGIDIRVSSAVEGFETRNNKLSAVVLSTGETIPCDVCIIGVGSIPNTEWLGGSVPLERGAVVCDENGQVQGFEDVYAVGDVAAWSNEGVIARHEHWTSAADQASQLVAGLLDQPEVAKPVSYIWSDQFDRRISLYGTTGGDLEAAKLNLPGSNPELGVGFYDDNDLVGVCVIGSPKDALTYRKALLQATQKMMSQ